MQAGFWALTDEKFLKLVKAKLGKIHGYGIRSASSGEEGIRLARLHQPEMILLDWLMPGMDGIDVLKELRDGQKTKECHIYMLTTKNKMGDVEDALHVGADGYLTKPIDMDKLAKRVEHIFHARFADGAELEED